MDSRAKTNTGTERRRSDATRNRAAILAAAARQLTPGTALSMRAVAEAAGVSRSTLYRHFPTRSSLETTLRDVGVAAARRAAERAASEERPPLAALRRLITQLVELPRAYRLDVLDADWFRGSADELGLAALPLLDRLREAAEIEPALPAEVSHSAAAQVVEACLRRGPDEPEESGPAADRLFRRLTDSLDQALVVLDPGGVLLAMNPPAEDALGLKRGRDLGTPVTAPRLEVVHEDGSTAPGSTYPLAAAVRSGDAQPAAVRGHRAAAGRTTWMEIQATPLIRHGAVHPYAVVGVLSDVSAEKHWELARLRPAGHLGRARPVPLDIARTLDEIPPHLFPEQFVSEARRITGTPVALYVLDIDGSHLLRLAGAEEFPARLEAPLALGPELSPDGIPDLAARIEDELPGVVMAPMWLRGRAVGVLLAVGGSQEALLELATHGAAAMELADGYTDAFDAARRRKETTAAAELQQSLVPPRIARMGSGELAGSVLPSYEVGGDWFDYVENRDGAWIAIADAVGKGATAGALGGIALAALRAARRSGRSLEETARSMHEVVFDVGRSDFFVTAIVARWHAVYSNFSWINCGHPPPLIASTDGTVQQLPVQGNLPLGALERESRFTRTQHRLAEGERLILHSDGITARKTEEGLFGVDGIESAVRRATSRSATAITRSIQEAVVAASLDPLQDDAVAVVLAPEAS